VSALRQSDLDAALGFLQEAEHVNGPTAFPLELLEGLEKLVPADVVHFCELDRVRERAISDTFSAGADAFDEAERADPGGYWRVRHEHPTCWHHEQTGDFTARKVSDFVTLRELRRREIYEQRFRYYPFELTVGLPAPPWHTKVFLFHRVSKDFRRRDVELLELLRPHFLHLWESAKMRRTAAALAAGAEIPGELVVFDSGHTVEFATATARRLLEAYFDGTRGGRLPPAVEDWLREEPRPRGPLLVERGQRRLVIGRLGGDLSALVLTEEASGAKPLSFREWQVVGLVEDGKSNAEIAAALWISPATVRTHLENIYAKLGVRSRTAAVARARNLKRVQSG
jgi:DNA-binding CsgD family transcriptional regulator